MMKLLGVIVLFLALLGIGVYFFAIPADVPNETPTQTQTYSSEKYGLSFTYPSFYELTEHDGEGSALREQHTIVLTNRADLPLPEGGEGPPTITIAMYQNNLDSMTTEDWIRGSSASNFKLSEEQRLTSVTLDGKPALSYRWSGLYEGTTIALARPDWIYAFTVTYFEPGADIVQDFVAVRDSVRIK
jgi:hypothetical protein